MKKITVLIMILAMLTLGACGEKAAEPSSAEPVKAVEATPVTAVALNTTQANATAETPAKSAKAEGAVAVALYDYALIEKEAYGTEIEVLGDVDGQEGYSVVKVNGKTGIMAKQFFQMNDAAKKTTKVYPLSGAKVYTGYDMAEEGAESFKGNTALTAIAVLDYCYVVEKPDGSIGCIANDEVQCYTHALDGESFKAVSASKGYEVSEKSGSEGKATVICNEAPLLAGLYDFEAEVQVVERGEKVCKLDCAGIEGEVEKRFVRFSDEEPYECWRGYVRGGAAGFKNIRLIGVPARNFSVNTVVTVLNEFEECYLVEYCNELYYVDLGSVRGNPWPIAGGHGEEWTEPIR